MPLALEIGLSRSMSARSCDEHQGDRCRKKLSSHRFSDPLTEPTFMIANSVKPYLIVEAKKLMPVVSSPALRSGLATTSTTGRGQDRALSCGTLAASASSLSQRLKRCCGPRESNPRRCLDRRCCRGLSRYQRVRSNGNRSCLPEPVSALRRAETFIHSAVLFNIESSLEYLLNFRKL